MTKVRCPGCGSEEVLSLTMVVRDTDLRFTCCVSCESRWWEKDGRSVALPSVLGLVAGR